MIRKITIGLLCIGIVAGVGAGCSHVHEHHEAHRHHFQDRVAEICVQAALKAVEAQQGDHAMPHSNQKASVPFSSADKQK
jgi:hypothetical protein